MVGSCSDVGNVRMINEDYTAFYSDKEKSIYVIADGMGGHNAGDVASKIAVTKTIDIIRDTKCFENGGEILKEAIEAANKEVYALSEGSSEMHGMGTTITACLIVKDTMFVANIGDSSCFVINTDVIKVTKDHSLVQELVDEGSITEAQAKNHPSKNIITRALGTGSKVEVDIYKVPMSKVSKIILCTDGLTNEMTTGELFDFIKESENNVEACKKLVEIAKSRGGRDNISVMIFEGER
jgi:PPM family protein phosphatase